MLGGLPLEFLKAETDYRRERMATQWTARTPRRHRPQTAQLPFGALLHRFGVRLGHSGQVGAGQVGAGHVGAGHPGAGHPGAGHVGAGHAAC